MAGRDEQQTDQQTDPVASEGGPEETSAQAPLLRVVRGNPSAEELAALVGVVASLSGGTPPAPRRVAEWSANHRKMRRTPPHGPQGWRASAMPR